jgi:hypothetical protein
MKLTLRYFGFVSPVPLVPGSARAMILAVLLGIQSSGAQDTNLLNTGAPDANVAAPASDVTQAEDATAADSPQSTESAKEDEAMGTNSVAETNQTAKPGPDARARRLRRQSQNRSKSNSSANREAGSAGTETNRNPNSLEFSAFRLVTDRNIFDPNRSPRSTRPVTTPKTTESFTLVGTMSYEKGSFAFFDGTGSEYKKVLKPADTIAGYKVVAVSSDSVKLMMKTNTLELTVGARMRRHDDGSWEKINSSESYAAATTSTSASSTEAAPTGAESDVLKKMMMRREKE